jgi:phosphopantetheinyl transferase (holo-ACP synthase)
MGREPCVANVGIDLEPADALDRLAPSEQRTFMARWLTPAERGWCLAQPSLSGALVVAMCCKEAVYKALGCVEAHRWQVEVDLGPEGTLSWATFSSRPLLAASVVWVRITGSILAVAVAGERLGFLEI